MKKILEGFVRVALLALAVTRCATDSKDSGSQTHWLDVCNNDADCTGALTCECGVCTKTCSGSATCSSLERDAVCVSPSSPAHGALCSSGDDPALCLPRCGEGCESGETCVGGACVPSGRRREGPDVDGSDEDVFDRGQPDTGGGSTGGLRGAGGRGGLPGAGGSSSTGGRVGRGGSAGAVGEVSGSDASTGPISDASNTGSDAAVGPLTVCTTVLSGVPGGGPEEGGPTCVPYNGPCSNTFGCGCLSTPGCQCQRSSQSVISLICAAP